MSFATFLERWANDSTHNIKRTQGDAEASYTIQTPNLLSECEILYRGVPALEQSHLTEANICWLRDQSNKLRCCYCFEGVFTELTYKHLDALFGKRIRDSQYCSENNERMLPNGIRVPVVPLDFIEHIAGKQSQRKRRKIQKARVKKAHLPHVNAILWFFYMGAAPATEECYHSILVNPPRIFAKNRSTLPNAPDGSAAVAAPRPMTSDAQRAAVMEVLETTRTAISEHGLYATQLENCCLASVRSMDDLVNLTTTLSDGTVVKIGAEIISAYNFLFPI